jgi:5-methylcytosine-specific restriction endonuclease McrA
LRKQAGAPTHPPLKLRFKILLRDGFQCTYCGAKPPQKRLRVDHIIPFSKGGETEENNLTTACFECNAGKADMPIDDEGEGA